MESDKLRSLVIIVTIEVARTASRHNTLCRKYLSQQWVFMSRTRAIESKVIHTLFEATAA
jgi:hypothetical protein